MGLLRSDISALCITWTRTEWCTCCEVNRRSICICLCEQRRGDLVACKVFRSDVSPREDVARQREFKVMNELKHENIVKFIAVEQEVTVLAPVLFKLVLMIVFLYCLFVLKNGSVVELIPIQPSQCHEAHPAYCTCCCDVNNSGYVRCVSLYDYREHVWEWPDTPTICNAVPHLN